MRNTIKEFYDPSCIGRVTLGVRNAKTNAFTPLFHKKNLIMYGAADIMAKLISGDNRFAISHMYYHYVNTANSPSINQVPSRADGINFFSSLGSTTEDWIRIPILTSAKIDTYYDYNPEDAYNNVYNGNMSTFVATSASHPTQQGESNASPANYFASIGDNGPSKIVGVALASSPDPSNKYKDIVFSRLSLSSPITVQENSYIDCFWSIAFK